MLKTSIKTPFNQFVLKAASLQRREAFRVQGANSVYSKKRPVYNCLGSCFEKRIGARVVPAVSLPAHALASRGIV
jgi:hypothetical protein